LISDIIQAAAIIAFVAAASYWIDLKGRKDDD
jgi:hypothetical protein